MSRYTAIPPYPVDLGSWLACFRYRLRNEDGHPYSPEQLGIELGVSGATVRRWEAGSGRPRAQDIVHLAQICSLTPSQLAFLNRALSASEIVVPPDNDTFRRRAEAMLSSPFPAYLLDDLYHTRAWNSYVDALPGRSQLMHDGQFLEVVLPQAALPAPWQRILLRDFWLLTADRCGLPEYRRILNRLARVPGFKEDWVDLALGDGSDDLPPVGAPAVLYNGQAGAFKVFSSQVLLPPVYYLREYVPLDAASQSRLEAVRAPGPPRVHFARGVHWAAD